MRKEDGPFPSKPTAYQLPEEDYAALIQARDQLALLASLCEPRGRKEANALSLSPEALGHCFQRFADELDTIVKATWWPTSVSAKR